MKLFQNVCLDVTLVRFGNGSCGVKTRSLGEISLCALERPSFASVFMNLYQDAWLDDISIKFKYESCQVKN